MSDAFWSNWNELTPAQQAIAMRQVSDARRANTNPDFKAITHNLMSHEQQSSALHNLSDLRKERKGKGGKRRSNRAHSKRRVHRKAHRKSHRKSHRRH
jgi:hypothetical protein